MECAPIANRTENGGAKVSAGDAVAGHNGDNNGDKKAAT